MRIWTRRSSTGWSRSCSRRRHPRRAVGNQNVLVFVNPHRRSQGGPVLPIVGRQLHGLSERLDCTFAIAQSLVNHAQLKERIRVARIHKSRPPKCGEGAGQVTLPREHASEHVLIVRMMRAAFESLLDRLARLVRTAGGQEDFSELRM